jgi:hypothetical protein
MRIPTCPLENDHLQFRKTGILHAINIEKNWHCTNPKHPKTVNGAETLFICVESECYYLRRTF